MRVSLPRLLIIILIQIAVALIHVFRLGQIFSGQAYDLYYSYFSDLVLPFSGYFLLAINDASIPIMRRWTVKAGIMFALTTTAEICQYFGLEVLGATFDPVDMVMYALGVVLAVIVDVKLLAPHFAFWQVPAPDETLLAR